MNKLVKKGFSMIELLFVMVILAALAAIAIPSMSSATDSATLTSMRSDTKNIMALVQSKFVEKQNYREIINWIDHKPELEGFAIETLADGTKIPLSKGNLLTLSNSAASGSCVTDTQGFEVIINNPSVNKVVGFNSCTDSKIVVEEIPEDDGLGDLTRISQ